MKKQMLLAVLGLAGGVASSYGTGYVIFSSYVANGGYGASTTFYGWPSGSPFLLGPGWTAGLYYAIGSVSDPVNFLSIASTSSFPTGLTDLGVTQAYATDPAVPGYFHGGIVTIPGYTSGPITFEVVAYNGSSYAASTWRSRSGSFTMNDISPSNILPATYFGDNGQPMPDFIVGVPEPTTLALAGLGGLAALVGCRRKS